MSKIKLLTIAVIGLLLINMGIVGYLLMKKPPMPPGGRPPMGQHDGPPPMRENGPKKIIAERLHFGKDQEAAYDKLIKEHQAAVKAYDDSIMKAKNNLYQSLQSETFAGKDSLVNRLGALQKQVELIHYEHFTAIKNLCRPDQLENFNKLTNELSRFFAPGKKDGPPPRD
jgi:hypothetical protein